MMMMIDAFQVEGITELAVDSVFMMPHLGVLSQIHEQAATEVFQNDCLIRLGTCIAPVGRPRGKAALLSFDLSMPDGSHVREKLAPGALQIIKLDADEVAHAQLQPSKGVDIGAGPGQPLEAQIRGGVCGLVFDGRGRRPLVVGETSASRALLGDLYQEIDLYPSSQAGIQFS